MTAIETPDSRIYVTTSMAFGRKPSWLLSSGIAVSRRGSRVRAPSTHIFAAFRGDSLEAASFLALRPQVIPTTSSHNGPISGSRLGQARRSAAHRHRVRRLLHRRQARGFRAVQQCWSRPAAPRGAHGWREVRM